MSYLILYIHKCMYIYIRRRERILEEYLFVFAVTFCLFMATKAIALLFNCLSSREISACVRQRIAE